MEDQELICCRAQFKVREKSNEVDMHCTRNCKNSKYHLYQNMLSYCKVCPSHVAENPFQHAC